MAVFLNAFQDLTESPLSQIYVTEQACLPQESRRLVCRATSPACSSAVRSEYGWGCFEVRSPGVARLLQSAPSATRIAACHARL